MLHRNQIASGLALLIIALTNGWHLAPIQGFAWLSMAVESSESETFTEALRSAMDRREMCGICQYVVEQKAELDESEIGYWNMIPKWLLSAPIIGRISLAPPQNWNRIPDRTLVLTHSSAALELPPPKGLQTV